VSRERPFDRLLRSAALEGDARVRYGLVVLLNGLPPSAPFEFQDWTRFGVGLVKTLFFVALPIWLAARLLDFVIGGPAKRKAKQNSN
jgi:hypothetical protein